MHEVSIINSALEIIFEKASDNNLKKINKITVKIGEMAGVLPEALLFAFESASKGTIAEGAQFNIEKVKPTARCDSCEIVFDINHFDKLCPGCGRFSGNILTGYELSINTIEGD